MDGHYSRDIACLVSFITIFISCNRRGKFIAIRVHEVRVSPEMLVTRFLHLRVLRWKLKIGLLIQRERDPLKVKWAMSTFVRGM